MEWWCVEWCVEWCVGWCVDWCVDKKVVGEMAADANPNPAILALASTPPVSATSIPSHRKS